MKHGNIFGESVFGGYVTGSDARDARPIRPGEAFHTGSQLVITCGKPVLNARGETRNADVPVKFVGPKQVPGQAIDITTVKPVPGTSMRPREVYGTTTSKMIPGYVREAGSPYYVGRAIPITNADEARQIAPNTAYHVGAARPVGPIDLQYGDCKPCYQHQYGARQQGVFHRPPQVGGFRHCAPCKFGPPNVGVGPLNGFRGLAGLIGFGG